MPTITIDGQKVEVEPGTTIIQAAEKLDIEVPRYCYHPGLSIVGQCRICLVEIERMPKLQVACYTPASDGMVVHTQTEKAIKGRKDVLELLLVNHPLDCPVCDQAGECWLQEYYMRHGQYDSKMIEDKVKKNKAVDIGPHVMLDSERCILCSRCVRFCDEVSKTSELGIFNRGDHAELLPYPDRELDNHYSVNTVDICPVGALTEKDFRFEARVWYLDSSKSICPGCSTGCNILVHANKERKHHAEGRRVIRLKPRYNADVNEWWMCDFGRYSFKDADDPSRILTPMLKHGDEWIETTWEVAIEAAAEKIMAASSDQVGVWASPKMTNEDLYLLKKLCDDRKISHLATVVAPNEEPFSDDYLISADKNPNTRGAEMLGLNSGPEASEKLLQLASGGELNALLIFDHDLTAGFDQDLVSQALGKVKTVIYVGSNQNPTSRLAHIILPAAHWTERDGTYVNSKDRVQLFQAAVDPLGDAKAGWQIVRRLGKAIGSAPPYFESRDVFSAITKSVPKFEGMSYELLGDSGIDLGEKLPDAEKKRRLNQVPDKLRIIPIFESS